MVTETEEQKSFYEELHAFANMCSETKGASFTLTKLRGNEKWQISLPAVGKCFKNDILVECLYEALKWLSHNRKQIEREITYTLFRE